MKANNDKLVKELTAIVAARKAEIEKTDRAVWLTHCSFSYSRTSSNPHERTQIQTVANLPDLAKILSFLYSEEANFNRAASTLGLNAKFEWQGYSLEEWETDLKTRVNKVTVAEKRKQLAQIESRLNALLSDEAKTESELDSIKKILNA